MGADDGARDRYAKYVLAVAVEARQLSLLGGGIRHFDVGGKGWGFKECIRLSSCSSPHSPYPKNVADDDSIVIHARVVSTEPATPPDSACDSSYDDQEEDCADIDQEEDTSSDPDYDPQEEDTSSDSDTDPQEEDSFSSDADSDQEEDTLDAGVDKPDHTEPDDQPNGASIEGSLDHESLSGQKLAAEGAPEGVQATQLSSHQLQIGFPYPEPLSSRARSTSSNLIAELSTLTSNGSALLLQQLRETMAKYLSMQLEAIHKTNSFEDIEQIAHLIADHPSAEVDKATLKLLLSELKEGVPSTMSIIKSSNATETSMAWMADDLEARLCHRHKQLGCLKDEVCRLVEEEKKLEGEIEQLVARKVRVGDQKKSTADELEKASREASKEMEEMKETSSNRKRASEDRLAAEEKLDQLKTSWLALKQTLGS